ncbi:hypothetical protein CKAN_00031900 [Cinnamomum micranthum f. kanehirae]|uniref:Uncharacterized protein n=1 Tax=Cinnamomum micranthum f. kanehirae TaxID=337451 RepID=A0A3S3PRJ5_9MAGN|nr:hypothetical protein CKAN_00031900 [Cinnamomum micranthum f. kanehirae]
MEPPSGFRASLLSFLHFLPFFLGLLLLGIIKGAIFCPLICLVMTIGNSAVLLGLWPAHAIWTCYCLARAKMLGPFLKILLCIFIFFLLVLWPIAGIVGSILGGAAYGLLSPLIATFNAVGEGKTNQFIHCILDGTWSTVKGSFTVVRDFKDVCFHSYFSVMDDLRLQEPSSGKPYEIRLLRLPGALFVGMLGIMVDMPVVTVVALYKSPYMLFKGWHRLLHDLIGREGPFLETACVPFAGLFILLWPLAVMGAVLASESSIRMGLKYIIASMSIFDEYSNDMLDMHEGSCFPRPVYQKTIPSRASSFSRSSFNKEKPDGKAPPSRSTSFAKSIIEFKLLELLDRLFVEFKLHGEYLIREELLTSKDIDDYKSNKVGGRIVGIGVPAYCILELLLHSAKANSDGLLLSDNATEITAENRPKDPIFGMFFDPLMIIKDQIKAENLTDDEEKYLRKLVLFNGDPQRLKNSNIGSPPETAQKQAELDALARRLQGITKTISRFPTIKRRTDDFISYLSEQLEKKSESQSTSRSRSGLRRIFSQKSFLGRTSSHGSDQETQLVIQNGLEIA